MTITKLQQNERRVEALQFLQPSTFETGNLKNVLIDHFAFDTVTGRKIIPYIPIRITTLEDGSIIPNGCKSNLTQTQMEELKINKKLQNNLFDKKGVPYDFKEIADSEATHYEIRLNFNKPKLIIDVDGLLENGDIKLSEYFDKPLPQQLKNAPFFLSRSKSLPHHLFYITDLPQHVNKPIYQNVFKSFHGDILLNHTWEMKDAKLYNYSGEIPTISWKVIEQWLDVTKKNAKDIFSKPATTFVKLTKNIKIHSPISPQQLNEMENESLILQKDVTAVPKIVVPTITIPKMDEEEKDVVNDEDEYEVIENDEDLKNSQIFGHQNIYNDEIKFYIENKSFNFGKGTHLDYIVFGGYLKCLCSEQFAYKFWEMVTMNCGTANKIREYATTWKYVKPMILDTLKTIQKIRLLVNKEKPTLRETWKEKQKQEKKINKEQEKQKAKEEEDEEQQLRKMNNTFVKDDDEAIDVIFARLKDNLIYTNGAIFLKRIDKNVWINDNDMLESYMLTYILESKLYKTNKTYDLIPYSAFVTTAKKIREGLFSKIKSNAKDDSQYNKFHTSTKNIICFNDGILNFQFQTFTKWNEIPKEDEIFTTVIINRDFENYFNNPNRYYIDTIVKDLFTGMFGEDETTTVLQFFARAISGNYQDKNFLSFRGNRNCGKGVLYDLFKATFEKYVGSFALNNIVCQRQSKKSSDEAKENAWLLPLEFQRISISQETPDNENNTIKQGLKLDNKALKTIMSGGDPIIGRKMFRDPIEFSIESVLCFFGNETLSVDGDANKHHYITSGVKQYVTQDEYNMKQSMFGDDYMTSYGVRKETLKDLVKYDVNYQNALVILLLEHWKNTPITIQQTNIYGETNKNESIRDLIFKNYEITKDKKDKIAKDDLVETLGKDKRKIIDELRQLGCVEPKDKCRMTIYTTVRNEKGVDEQISKQVQAFYKIKKREIKIAVDEKDEKDEMEEEKE